MTTSMKMMIPRNAPWKIQLIFWVTQMESPDLEELIEIMNDIDINTSLSLSESHQKRMSRMFDGWDKCNSRILTNIDIKGVIAEINDSICGMIIHGPALRDCKLSDSEFEHICNVMAIKCGGIDDRGALVRCFVCGNCISSSDVKSNCMACEH